MHCQEWAWLCRECVSNRIELWNIGTKITFPWRNIYPFFQEWPEAYQNFHHHLTLYFLPSSGSLKVVSTTTIDVGPRDMTARIGERLEIPCKVIWDPKNKLSVDWLKNNGEKIDMSGRFSKKSEGADNTLVIEGLEFADKGWLNFLHSCPIHISSSLICPWNILLANLGLKGY